ncbi:MAG: hypothetical protein JNN13_04535 [Planctomycetes bacterium]|nr:hypothetical protein [Planctomycetota bacterium]
MRYMLPAAAAAISLVTTCLAQSVDPVGHSHPNAQPLASVATIRIPALDRLALATEDEQRHLNGDPARYAVPFVVQVNPKRDGTWEALDNTWSLWRLRIDGQGASHLNFGFGQFQLPAGARLQVYSSDYTCLVRPFDASDHQPTGELWTPIVLGDQAVIEVYTRTAARDAVAVELVQVGAGYRFFGAGVDALGTDASGSCNVDVACAQGAAWANEIPAVAAISTGGSIFCTGSMINNTAQDGRNFFLTANHCGIISSNAASLVCYWNYENANCGGGGYSLSQFTTGSTWRAGYSTSDVTLVELNSTPNPAWGITYAGWNRSTGDFASAVCIHHPSGDVKKISFENDATTTTSYSGTTSPGNGSHVRVIDWDVGTTEPGSSGSPLYDPNHRYVGQLHGGSAACGNNLSDYYGRFSVSWTGGGTNSTRLSNWLDPLGTGQTTVDTMVPGSGNLATATASGSGCYATAGAFAQTFAASSFDLAGTTTTTVSLLFTPTGSGYTVGSGPNAWYAPIAASLGLGDDATTACNLPFTFSFPGGSTSAVRMCSNGFVWLNGSTTTTDYTPTTAELASGLARMAPLWMDLAPNLGGSCHFDVDPSNTAVYFTWNNVPAYTSGTVGAGNYCQLVLRNNGQVEYRYRQVPNQPGALVTGYSRGGQATPADRDLSASLPFVVSIDGTGLTWTATNRPILGTTQHIDLGNVPNPAASIGLVIVGFTAIPAGLDLAVIGAPGCFLYTQAASIDTLFPLGATTQWSLVIPNTPSLNGALIQTQGAALVPPGSNAFGLLTGNRVELKLGTS